MSLVQCIPHRTKPHRWAMSWLRHCPFHHFRPVCQPKHPTLLYFGRYTRHKRYLMFLWHFVHVLEIERERESETLGHKSPRVGQADRKGLNASTWPTDDRHGEAFGLIGRLGIAPCPLLCLHPSASEWWVHSGRQPYLTRRYLIDRAKFRVPGGVFW